MIYRINESAKSDEFIKTMPKKIPATTGDIDEKFADKRFDDWHSMSDNEKREVLTRLNIAQVNQKSNHTPSNNKYYYATYNGSIKLVNDKMVPRAGFESTIFECVEFI